MKKIALGPISIHAIAELPALAVGAPLIFANSTPELLARGREWLDGRFIHPRADEVYIDFHSFVIETGGLTILVDTCHGNHKTRRAPIEYANDLDTDFLGALARAGFTPAQIDVVLCTHLHFDHVGWNTRLEDGRWIPTFPNARYLISREDYRHFEREHRLAGSMEAEAFIDSVLPIVAAGQADLIDTGHVIERDLAREVWIEGMPGHTPGLIALHAGSRSRKAIFCGDVLHHPLQVMDPALHLHVDWDVAMATAARRRLLESCAGRDTLLMTAHFPDPIAGRVTRHGELLRFEFEPA